MIVDANLLTLICIICLQLAVISAAPVYKSNKWLGLHKRHPMVMEQELNDLDIIIYLRKYGYLPADTKYGYGVGIKSTDIKRALRTFQGFTGLEPTGELDAKTLEVMKKPRCGVKDIEIGQNSKRNLLKIKKHKRMKRFAVQGTKLQTTQDQIKYSIDQYSKKLTKSYVIDTLQYAFNVWSKHTPLDFVQVVDNAASDVKVLFARSYHGDGQPFDGAGRDLAHAFYPERGSDVHFDDDEPWGPNGRNLLWVAAHEIGHSLGLKHSSDPSSLMHATYGGYGKTKEDVYLTTDDIAGIQSLYGRRKHETKSTKKVEAIRKRIPGLRLGYKKSKSVAKKPTRIVPEIKWKSATVVPDKRPQIAKNNEKSVAPKTDKVLDMDICQDSTIDAMVVLDNGTVYAFKGANYWRLNMDSGTVDPEFPRPIHQDWNNIPDNIDAALQEPFTAIIKGRQGSMLEENEDGLIKPDPLKPLDYLGAFSHLPHPIDAALSEGSYDGSFWFFKGTKYWRDMDWDGLPEEDSMTKKPDYMNLRQIHQSLRHRTVNAAVNIPSGPRKGLYIFFGSQYLRVYQFRGRLVSFGQPRSTGRDWFGCP